MWEAMWVSRHRFPEPSSQQSPPSEGVTPEVSEVPGAAVVVSLLGKYTCQAKTVASGLGSHARCGAAQRGTLALPVATFLITA